MIQIRTIEDAASLKISTRLMVEEALRKNYKVEFYPSSPETESGIVKCSKHQKTLVFMSTLTTLTPVYSYFTAENKVLTNNMLQAAHVNMPDSICPGTEDETIFNAFLKKHDTLVVKPAAMNHGDGVTTNITTIAALKKAVNHATSVSHSKDVILQQQVSGREYRFLVIRDKVVAVAGRRPPYVLGNGTSTIAMLIQQKNQDPRRGDGHKSVLTKINLEDVIRLNGAGFLKRIPAKDELVQLLNTSNLSRGGEAIDYTDLAHKDLKEMAVKAAKACFLGVTGVDIITNNVENPDLSQSYVIEVNLGPGLRMHHYPSEGQPRNVARLIFREAERSMLNSIESNKKMIGRAETITIPKLAAKDIPARIDTGARTSALWVSNVQEDVDKHELSFTLFGKGHTHYTGQPVVVKSYDTRVVASSIGVPERRYLIKLQIVLKGKIIQTSFTLANRSQQVYPVLIGRNTLKGKFVVDVQRQGKSLITEEKIKEKQLETKF